MLLIFRVLLVTVFGILTPPQAIAAERPCADPPCFSDAKKSEVRSSKESKSDSKTQKKSSKAKKSRDKSGEAGKG